MYKKNRREEIIGYIKKRQNLYYITKGIYKFIFLNPLIGRMLWLKAKHNHTSSIFSYEPCLCGNSSYTTYLNYGKNKVIECTKCKLWRNFPKPESGVYEKEMAVGYDNNPEVSTQLKEIFTQFKKYLPIEINILDFGCGDGRAIVLAKELGFKNIYGLEISNHLLKRARGVGAIVFDDINEIPKDLRFDIIIADNVFEHVPNLNGELLNIKKIMSDNGTLIAFVPNIRSKKMHTGYLDLLWNTHYWQFNPETFSGLLKRNDFNVLDCKTLTENSDRILKISNPEVTGKENGCVFVVARAKK